MFTTPVSACSINSKNVKSSNFMDAALESKCLGTPSQINRPLCLFSWCFSLPSEGNSRAQSSTWQLERESARLKTMTGMRASDRSLPTKKADGPGVPPCGSSTGTSCWNYFGSLDVYTGGGGESYWCQSQVHTHLYRHQKPQLVNV